MLSSRATVVLGMHRSGTSAFTRGLQALGVYLGDNFLSVRPDNPTGYWEDRGIVDLNERLLTIFGLQWESIALIEDGQWNDPMLQALHLEAAEYIRTRFVNHAYWGFKDPRLSRLLPFWRSVFKSLGIEDRYLLAIRNPLSVASSLRKRQGMEPAVSHMLWLVYVVPCVQALASETFAVAEYDLLMADPRAELERIACRLGIPVSKSSAASIEDFTAHFLDPNLCHNAFRLDDFDAIPGVSPLTREAYLWLYQLATDRIGTDSARFWSAWEHIRNAVQAMIAERRAQHRNSAHPNQSATSVPSGKQPSSNSKWNSVQMRSRFESERETARPPDGHDSVKKGRVLFVVVGNQRTGTNLLREVLNTNPQIAMLGEILSASPAPAHWDNFLSALPPGTSPTARAGEAEALLDRYFDFVEYRIRNHWVNGDKSGCRAIGVDIKYNQLRRLAPANWNPAEPPFVLGYLKSRHAILVHTIRRNVIHCALSAAIASQRNIWHNYGSERIDRSYRVDPNECLAYARTILRDRDRFLTWVEDYTTITCCYEDLVDQIATAAPGQEIPASPGPLRDIACALETPFRFRYDGRLRRTIDVPYSQLLSNHDALVRVVRESEFASFCGSL